MDGYSAIRDDLAALDRSLEETIGGLQMQLNTARSLVAYRTKVLGYEVRTQRMLGLVTLHLQGADQVEAHTRLIRAALEVQHATAPRQRVGVTGGRQMHRPGDATASVAGCRRRSTATLSRRRTGSHRPRSSRPRRGVPRW